MLPSSYETMLSPAGGLGMQPQRGHVRERGDDRVWIGSDRPRRGGILEREDPQCFGRNGGRSGRVFLSWAREIEASPRIDFVRVARVRVGVFVRVRTRPVFGFATLSFDTTLAKGREQRTQIAHVCVRERRVERAAAPRPRDT